MGQEKIVKLEDRHLSSKNSKYTKQNNVKNQTRKRISELFQIILDEDI